MKHDLMATGEHWVTGSALKEGWENPGRRVSYDTQDVNATAISEHREWFIAKGPATGPDLGDFYPESLQQLLTMQYTIPASQFCLLCSSHGFSASTFILSVWLSSPSNLRKNCLVSFSTYWFSWMYGKQQIKNMLIVKVCQEEYKIFTLSMWKE